MLLAVLFASFLMLLWVAFPLLRPRATGGVSADDEMTRERVDSLLHALRKLYQRQSDEDQRDQDFVNIEKGLMLKLANIYHSAGINPSVAEREPKGAPEMVAQPVEEKTEAAADFCHQCGKPSDAKFKFCPRCGTDLRPAA